MNSSEDSQQLNTDLCLKKIVARLPYTVRGSKCKVVGQCEEKNEDVNFDKLVSFIVQQAQVDKRPVFSAEALASLEGKVKSHIEAGKPTSTRHKDNANIKTLFMATNVTGPRPAARSLPSTSTLSAEMFCATCNRSNHDPDFYRKYLGKSVENFALHCNRYRMAAIAQLRSNRLAIRMNARVCI
jgi:hypothetical protein